jgi:hypothetical protein
MHWWFGGTPILHLLTFSNFFDHTSPLFLKLNILKMHDLVFYWNAALFMHDFYNGNLPKIFGTFFLVKKNIIIIPDLLQD